MKLLRENTNLPQRLLEKWSNCFEFAGKAKKFLLKNFIKSQKNNANMSGLDLFILLFCSF